MLRKDADFGFPTITRFHISDDGLHVGTVAACIVQDNVRLGARFNEASGSFGVSQRSELVTLAPRFEGDDYVSQSLPADIVHRDGDPVASSNEYPEKIQKKDSEGDYTKP